MCVCVYMCDTRVYVYMRERGGWGGNKRGFFVGVLGSVGAG